MVSAVKVGGRRLHELARQGVEVERAARPVTVYRFDTEPDPARPGRLPGRGGVLVGHLRPGPGRTTSGRRSAAARTWRNLRRTRIGSFGEAEMRPLDALGPDAVLTPAQAMRDLDARRPSTPAVGRLHPHRARRSTGCRWARPATGRGRCSTTRGTLLAVYEATGTRPHPAGRRAGRGVTARPTTLGRDARTRNRRHHRGLRRGPPRAPRPAARPVRDGPRRPGSPPWWSPSTATRPTWCARRRRPSS